MAISDFLARGKPTQGGCIEWQGAIDRNGYGKLHQQLAHRIAYRLAHGVDPGLLAVCHACDNPPCINPEHLWLGTRGDNNRDAQSKGRVRGMSLTHCKHGHEFTPANTYWRKVGGRQCRKCNTDAVARRAARIKASAA